MTKMCIRDSIYRITHKNKKIKKKDIDTKQKLRYDKNVTKRYYTETNTRTERKNMNEKIYYSAEAVSYTHLFQHTLMHWQKLDLW